MNNWYGWVEIGKLLCKIQCLLDSNHVGLDNRQNRDRVDLEVNGYQSSRGRKDRVDCEAIWNQSGISRDDPVAIGKKEVKKKYSLTTRSQDCFLINLIATRPLHDRYPITTRPLDYLAATRIFLTCQKLSDNNPTHAD